MHGGLLRQPRAAHVRACDAGADGGVDAGAGADAGAEPGADFRADSGGMRGRIARVRRERGRYLLRRSGRLGVRLRGGVRVHRGLLRQPRAAHVRACDAGADAGVDANADAYSGSDAAYSSSDACADAGELCGRFACCLLYTSDAADE